MRSIGRSTGSLARSASRRWRGEGEPRGGEEDRGPAQLLDGSPGDARDGAPLGFLQIDVVQPVERPQHLVLFSRLGPCYDRAELDRLLWEERALFEWNAFIYPIEDLPLVRARIRSFRRERKTKNQRWVRDFLTTNRAFRRYVLRELETRWPALARPRGSRQGCTA